MCRRRPSVKSAHPNGFETAGMDSSRELSAVQFASGIPPLGDPEPVAALSGGASRAGL